MEKCCKIFCEKIKNTVVVILKNSEFYEKDFLSSLNKCLEQLGHRQIEQILCYGLGSFHSGFDVPSRFQLALLLLMYNHLVELNYPLNEEIELFDPSFDSFDKEILLNFDKPRFKIIVENEYCARKLNSSSSTLIYMPHLDKYLYNNLLGANWSPEDLSKLVVLGNSFQEMIDNEVSSKCKSDLYYINLLVCNFESDHVNSAKRRNRATQQRNGCEGSGQDQKALIELKIDDSSFGYSGGIFNNLAFHIINETWLKENQNKIQLSRLKGWQCATPSPQDSEWPD